MSIFMKEFLIFGVFIGGFTTLFFGTLICCNDSLSVFKKILSVIAVFVFFGTMSGGLITLEHKNDYVTWNNGYCECGNEWELKNVEHIKNGGNKYYYWCDDCGNIIELSRNGKSV